MGINIDLNNKKATRQSYGEALLELGKINKKVVVLDADLSGATKTSIFANEFKDRFFDMGISEQDMVGTAAGLATCGKIPYVSSFAMFLVGRAYDQIRNSVAYPKLNVKLCATHAGITVGEDGATHQMLEDLSIMRSIPNMKVFSASDDIETKWLVNEISKIDGPVYLRLSRLETPRIYDENQKFEIGKGIQIGDGKDGTVFATGVTLFEALKAKEELEKRNIYIRVVDMHSIKPIDKELIIKSVKETNKVVTIEDHNVIGGIGTVISEVLCEEGISKKIFKLGINDEFGKSGQALDLMHSFGITFESVVEKFINE